MTNVSIAQMPLSDKRRDPEQGGTGAAPKRAPDPDQVATVYRAVVSTLSLRECYLSDKSWRGQRCTRRDAEEVCFPRTLEVLK